MGHSLSADPNIMDLLQGEQPDIWTQSDTPPVDLSVGDIRSQIAAEWLQIAQRSKWIAYRKPPSLFEWCHADPLRPPLPRNGGSICPKIHEWPYLHNGDPIHLVFGSSVGFSGSVDQMALFPVTSNPIWRQ